MFSAKGLLWSAATIAALTMTLAAQQAPPTTYAEFCVKVKHGQEVAFAQFVEGDMHKYQQERVDSGAMSGYIAMRTEMPAGKAAHCDYVFLEFFSGMPKAPPTDAEVGEALQKAGIGMTADEWGQKEMDVGVLVSNSLEMNLDLVGDAHKGDYIVYNSMKVPEGKIDDWIQWEKTMWGPLAESMVKSGQLSGWALDIQMFPGGAKDKGLESTSDIYPNWSAFVEAREHYESAWKAVHPNDDMMATMEQLGKLSTIEHAVLYKVVDQIRGK